MKSVLLLNGPNLNMLGKRDPHIYGDITLAGIEKICLTKGTQLGISVTCAQSNHEGVLVDHIHASQDSQDGIVLNPGAYTHTSIALMDAIASVDVPVVEIHLSNIYAREPFRRHSCLAPAVMGQIAGFGANGYELAIEALAALFRRQ